jgi:hypothetical protein
MLGYALGAVLILLGVAVPAHTWVAGFHGALPDPGELLLKGATLLRMSLAVLGLFVLAGTRLKWWKPGPSDLDEARQDGAGDHDPVLWLLLALALALRLYRLNEGLWQDEILALVNYFRLPFGALVTTFDSENQHFLYSILAHASFRLFGESAWALRLPAALFGVGSIWALYVFAVRLASRREARLSAGLLTVSHHHIWFSQNGRGYTGLLFFTLLSSWLLQRAMSERRPRFWLWYAVTVALGTYTHLTMVFVAVVHGVWYLWQWVRARRNGQPWPQGWIPLASGFILSALLTFTLYALVVPQFLNTALAEASVVATWKSPAWTVQETLRALHLGGGRGIGLLFALAILATGFWSYCRKAPLVALLLVGPALIAGGIGLKMGHHLWPRTFFFVAGFGVMILVRGVLLTAEAVGQLIRLSPAHQARLGTAGALGLILMSCATVPSTYGPKQDFAGARDLVEHERQPGDTVVAMGLATVAYQRLYAPTWGSVGTIEDLNAVRRSSRRTWVVYTLRTYMASELPDLLDTVEREFQLVRSFPGTLGDGTVFVYRIDAQEPAASLSDSSPAPVGGPIP